MKRPVWAAAALLGVLVASATLFAEGKRYPPYPDVWGYELAYAAPGRRDVSPRVFLMPNGEIQFLTLASVRQEKTMKRPAYQWALLEYFTGIVTPMREPEVDWFIRDHRAQSVKVVHPGTMSATFGDGSSIRVVQRGTGSGICPYHWFGTWLVARDPRGAERRSVHILYLRPDEVVAQVNPRCAEGEEGLEFRYRVENVVPAGMAPLADDSVVIWEGFGNVILRLDKDLNTRFRLGHRVFVLEHGELERLIREAGDRDEQQRHDAVLRHLLKNSGSPEKE